MRDPDGEIIYVGKAVSLRKRVQSYFRDASLKSASPKIRSLVNSVNQIDIIEVHNEAAALLTEDELIKTYQPRYNVLLKDDKRFLLLRVDQTIEIPRFELVRLRRNDKAIYFGPYISSTAARGTLDFIEKHFGLRKCTPLHPDLQTYKHCNNDIIRFCSAPCINRIAPDEYRDRIQQACDFLRGRRPDLIKHLREQMQTASANLDFEQAASLRDTLHAINRAIKQHARAIPNISIHKQDALAGLKQLQEILSLPTLPHVIEAFDISNILGTHAVASMVCAVDGIPAPNRYRRFKIKTVEGANDPAMMAEVITRRIRGLRENQQPFPDLILVDGGITQLNATRQVLQQIGATEIPTAGLAKRHEEIVTGSDTPPLRLERNAPGLKVLQRLRDEAHRFAITYHRTLRNRRIRESRLDEIPGIGQKRKELLLQTFGSVRRILNAGPEGIAQVPGIGSELAQAIYTALQSKSN